VAVSVFEWLEETRLALWVGESLWGYPLLLSLHIVGLAMVAGIFTMLNIRLLGILKEIEFSPLIGLFRLAWIGLLVNALSGFGLFSSQATIFVTSTPFLVKIAAIIVGVIIATRILKVVRRDAGDWDAGTSLPDQRVKLLAVASLLCWVVAIVGGRLIAYL
jgi:hypothetical protein